MPRHREKVREIPGVNGVPAARYPGRTPARPEIDLKCPWCGRVMAQGGWWMAADLGLALGLVAGKVTTPLECRVHNFFDVDGRWLWDALNDATAEGYGHVTIPRRYARSDDA